MGAPRIVPGRGIPFPAGDADLPPEAERDWRRRLVARCLDAVTTSVDQPTVFHVEEKEPASA